MSYKTDWFLLILLHFTADFWFQSAWMATRKHQEWWAAIVHGAVYGAVFLLATRDPIALLILAASHAVIDHHRIATVIPRIVNWKWDDWQFRGWLNLQTYDPNDQASYFPPPLHWLNIVADQVLHLWIVWILFR